MLYYFQAYYHFGVISLQALAYLFAAILLVKKGKEFGPKVMLASAVVRLVSAPIFWMFTERINELRLVWLVQTVWVATTVGFSLGLLIYAIEKKKV
jgi:hypothetical protein